MRQLIAGNWKMNGTRAQAAPLAGAVARAAPGLACDFLLCPPFPLLDMVGAALAGSGVALGGQDCHDRQAGAHTGDTSPAMLRDIGCTWVILGHSERRADHAESDLMVRAKAQAALQAGLAPIICVGETEQHRLSGNAEFVVASQLDGSVPDDFHGAIAYEPVWAIGTGRSATEDDIATMHAAIRNQLVNAMGEAGRGVRILYGGSVKPANAAAVLAIPEVGGALVGGASLDAADFLAIARACS